MPRFVSVLFLLGALGLGLAVHGVCIRLGWLAALARPLDFGRKLGGRPIFGANKTFRGVIAVAAGSAVGAALADGLARAALPSSSLARLNLPSALLLGFGLGAAAMLSELPNSFLKRRLDIPPGQAPSRGVSGALFFVLDQVDMLIGWWLILALAIPPNWATVAGSAAIWLVLHQAISGLGAALGMRPSAR